MTYPETNLEAALAYAKRGWYVLPIIPGGKIPASSHGTKDASIDPAVITGWFKERPDLNVGIALEQSKLLLVDVDTHGGYDGHETLEIIERTYGKVDSNCVQQTPSGGTHYIFSNPEGLAFPAKFFPDKGNVDLKSNGYFVAYPSTRSDYSGQRYEWEAEGDPLEHNAPATLLPEGFKKIARSAPANNADGPEVFVPVTEPQWQELRLAIFYISAVDRSDWLNVGMALQSTGRDDAKELWDEWSKTSPANFRQSDNDYIWKTFHARGLEGVTYRTIFSMAMAAGYTTPPAIQQANSELSSTPAAPIKKRNPITFASSIFDEVIHQRPIIKHWIPSNALGVMYGESGSGKTWVAIDMALSIALGLKWCSQKTVKTKVLYIAAEGGDGVAMRVKGWMLGHKDVTAEQIDENFRILPDRVDLSAQRSQDTAVPTAEDIKNWLDEMDFHPGFIVIDTLSQTLSGDENAASDIASYMNNISTYMREPFKAGVMLIHHSGKAAGAGFRGSSAIKANTSFMIRVDRSSETEQGCRVSVEHMKDWMIANPVRFEWNSVEIGRDDDGEILTSIYMTPEGGSDDIWEKLSQNEIKAKRREILLEIVKEIQPAPVDAVQNEFFKKASLPPEDRNRSSKFSRAVKYAIEAGAIVQEDGFLTLGSTKNTDYTDVGD